MHKQRRSLAQRAMVLGLAVGASTLLAPTAPARAAGSCADPTGVCVDGASFKADTGLTDAARKKEAKRYRKKKDLQLHVAVTQGRASVFVDGVWLGLAPIENFALKPGKHDLVVRDKETVMANGVITISSKAKGEVKVVVNGNAA